MIRRSVVLPIVIVLGFTVATDNITLAQDPLFAQFYYSPAYLNPGFTGCGKNDFRASFSSRLQWVNLPSPLQSYSLNADYYIASPKASLGLMMNRFDEGYLKTTQAYVLAAKNFGADEYDCRNWFLNFAFQAGFGYRDANRNKYLFPDQIGVDGPNGQASQAELFQYANKPYFDISSGFVFTWNNFMVGGAVHHLNKPMYGLIGSNDESRLPRRYTAHCSFISDKFGNIDYTNESKILLKPTVIYTVQDVSKSLMIGTLLDFPDGLLQGGIWYKNNLGGGNNLGIADNHSIFIGITIKLGQNRNYYNGDAGMRFHTGSGYEAEMFGPQVKTTHGSAELGMLYENNWNGDGICPKPYGDCSVRYPWVFF